MFSYTHVCLLILYDVFGVCWRKTDKKPVKELNDSCGEEPFLKAIDVLEKFFLFYVIIKFKIYEKRQ